MELWNIFTKDYLFTQKFTDLLGFEFIHHYILLGESRYGVFVFVIYNLKYFELFRRSSRVKYLWISLFTILRLLISILRNKIKIIRNHDSITKNNFFCNFPSWPTNLHCFSAAFSGFLHNLKSFTIVSINFRAFLYPVFYNFTPNQRISAVFYLFFDVAVNSFL